MSVSVSVPSPPSVASRAAVADVANSSICEFASVKDFDNNNFDDDNDVDDDDAAVVVHLRADWHKHYVQGVEAAVAAAAAEAEEEDDDSSSVNDDSNNDGIGDWECIRRGGRDEQGRREGELERRRRRQQRQQRQRWKLPRSASARSTPLPLTTTTTLVAWALILRRVCFIAIIASYLSSSSSLSRDASHCRRPWSWCWCWCWCWCCHSLTTVAIRQHSWTYKNCQIGWEDAVPIHAKYDNNGNGNDKNVENSTKREINVKVHKNKKGTTELQDIKEEKEESALEPIVLLNGFGVGSFHQHRLMPELVRAYDHRESDAENDTFDIVVIGKEEDDNDDDHNDEENTTGSGSDGDTTQGPQRGATLLLTERNRSRSRSRHRAVYGIDYLGQGRSWPINCDDGNSASERGLRYCIDTWSDQIERFIEDIVLPRHAKRGGGGAETTTGAASSSSSLFKTNTIKTKVHLVGNSVGGHLSALLALRRPDLIRSVVLLNATPVWGLNLPGWSGRLPPPPIPRAIGRYLFDRIRNLDTIEQYLMSAYANRRAFIVDDDNDGNGNDGNDDNDLCRQIRACTEGKGGHAAFASILWSPPASVGKSRSIENVKEEEGKYVKNKEKEKEERTEGDFYSNLSKMTGIDALLIFGTDDPWCKPAFARRMNRALASRGSKGGRVGDSDVDAVGCHRYVEIDNVGHCPNHESPRAVGRVVRRWIDALERGDAAVAPLVIAGGGGGVEEGKGGNGDNDNNNDSNDRRKGDGKGGGETNNRDGDGDNDNDRDGDDDEYATGGRGAADGDDDDNDVVEAVNEPSWGGTVYMKDRTECYADGSMWRDIGWFDRLVSRLL